MDEERFVMVEQCQKLTKLDAGKEEEAALLKQFTAPDHDPQGQWQGPVRRLQ